MKEEDEIGGGLSIVWYTCHYVSFKISTTTTIAAICLLREVHLR